MLVEAPPPPPFDGAIWTGGYWVWHDTWVWAHGRWAAPPRPEYRWHPPYYEHRDGMVVFITGHWGAPGVVFVPPAPGIHIHVEIGGPGVIAGPRPWGPPGVFVPPPPGSRAGIIIPAPVGTAPSVVTGAPPVVNVGMRITNNMNSGNTTTNITNNRTTIVNNVTNVTIVAPAGVTASGQAVSTSVPAQAHLAAALPPVVHAPAPMPNSTRPVPAFVHGQPHVDLPPPQPLRPMPTPQPHPAVPAPTPAKPLPAPSPAATPVQHGPERSVPDHAAPPPERPREDAHPPRDTAKPRPTEPRHPTDSETPAQRNPTPVEKAKPATPNPTPKAKDAPKPKPRDEKEAKTSHERERD